uniref:Uncharacterized protein n=1 Tax=Arundo donax TaxID=35708 RepID=A0A0A9A8V5_ARUDO
MRLNTNTTIQRGERAIQYWIVTTEVEK